MQTKVGLFGIGLDTYWAQFVDYRQSESLPEQLKTG